MVSVLASSTIDCGYEPWSCQTKEYNIGICCFSSKNAALRRKSRDWLARNQNNVSECMSSYTFVFGFWPRYLFLVLDSCWATVRNSNMIYPYKLINLQARTSQRAQSKTIRTTLISALFRQFDSFFGAIDTIYVHCRKIYNSFPLAAKQVRKTRQNSSI